MTRTPAAPASAPALKALAAHYVAEDHIAGVEWLLADQVRCRPPWRAAIVVIAAMLRLAQPQQLRRISRLIDEHLVRCPPLFLARLLQWEREAYERCGDFEGLEASRRRQRNLSRRDDPDLWDPAGTAHGMTLSRRFAWHRAGPP